MGLLLSSPGVHVSWTLLSSWLVNSKSKGGFGTSGKQTHKNGSLSFSKEVLSLWCYAQRDALETHHSYWSVSMQWKGKRHSWGCWERCTPKPTHQGALLACFFKIYKIVVCQIHWGSARVLGMLSKEHRRKWHQSFISDNTREAEQSRMRDKCEQVACAVQRLFSILRLGGKWIWS